MAKACFVKRSSVLFVPELAHSQATLLLLITSSALFMSLPFHAILTSGPCKKCPETGRMQTEVRNCEAKHALFLMLLLQFSERQACSSIPGHCSFPSNVCDVMHSTHLYFLQQPHFSKIMHFSQDALHIPLLYFLNNMGFHFYYFSHYPTQIAEIKFFENTLSSFLITISQSLAVPPEASLSIWCLFSAFTM